MPAFGYRVYLRVTACGYGLHMICVCCTQLRCLDTHVTGCARCVTVTFAFTPFTRLHTVRLVTLRLFPTYVYVDFPAHARSFRGRSARLPVYVARSRTLPATFTVTDYDFGLIGALHTFTTGYRLVTLPRLLPILPFVRSTFVAFTFTTRVYTFYSCRSSAGCRFCRVLRLVYAVARFAGSRSRTDFVDAIRLRLVYRLLVTHLVTCVSAVGYVRWLPFTVVYRSRGYGYLRLRLPHAGSAAFCYAVGSLRLRLRFAFPHLPVTFYTLPVIWLPFWLHTLHVLPAVTPFWISFCCVVPCVYAAFCPVAVTLLLHICVGYVCYFTFATLRLRSVVCTVTFVTGPFPRVYVPFTPVTFTRGYTDLLPHTYVWIAFTCTLVWILLHAHGLRYVPFVYVCFVTHVWLRAFTVTVWMRLFVLPFGYIVDCVPLRILPLYVSIPVYRSRLFWFGYTLHVWIPLRLVGSPHVLRSFWFAVLRLPFVWLFLPFDLRVVCLRSGSHFGLRGYVLVWLPVTVYTPRTTVGSTTHHVPARLPALHVVGLPLPPWLPFSWFRSYTFPRLPALRLQFVL